jgi:purine-nucleoside phosphorylase
MTMTIAERVQLCAQALRVRQLPQPEVAIILGSGLGPLAEQLDNPTAIAFADLPGFPLSTAPGHAGRLLVGTLAGKTVLAFQGRVHLYEGYSAKEAAMPVHLAQALSVRDLIVTNACGGLNPHWNAGDIMLQLDFINFTGQNPLTGPNDASVGPRFLPTNDAYDAQLCQIARAAARKLDLELREGVYLAVAGPTYANRAELRMMRGFGADTIGMSTVSEVIAARYYGMRVLGLSSITDMAVADREDHSGTSEEAVIAQAQQTGPRFRALVSEILAQWI